MGTTPGSTTGNVVVLVSPRSGAFQRKDAGDAITRRIGICRIVRCRNPIGECGHLRARQGQPARVAHKDRGDHISHLKFGENAAVKLCSR